MTAEWLLFKYNNLWYHWCHIPWHKAFEGARLGHSLCALCGAYPVTEPLQSDQGAATQAEQFASDIDFLTALVQIGLGGAAIGAAVLREPSTLQDALTSGEPGVDEGTAAGALPPPESTTGRAVEGMVGLALGTQQAVRTGVSRAWGLNKRLLRATTAPVRASMDVLGVTGLVSGPADAVAGRVQSTVQTLEDAGRAELQVSRGRAGRTLAGTIDTIVAYLAQSPAVDALIRLQVDKLLPLLADHPAVEQLIQVQVDKILPVLAESAAIRSLILAQLDQVVPELANSAQIQDLIDAQVAAILPKLADDMRIQELIRKQAGAYLFYLSNHSDQIQALIRQQGDIYIDYLNDHPDAVQQLVSGQSLGIAGQVMDEVRERTVTADSVAETLVRSILRKKARTELESPPDAVQRRAVVGVLPSDYVQTKERHDGK